MYYLCSPFAHRAGTTVLFHALLRREVLFHVPPDANLTQTCMPPGVIMCDRVFFKIVR